MKLSDFNIVYINIDDRIDRRKSIENQLNKNDLTATRISAVYGIKLKGRKYRQQISKELNIPEEKLTPKFWMNRSNFKSMITNQDLILGRVGCFLSHIKCYKHALDNNWDNILILEDDINILQDSNKVEFILPEQGKADVYYFGGMFWHSGPNGFDKNTYDGEETDNKWIMVDPNKLKLIGCFAYSFGNKDSIIDIFNLCMSVFIDSDKGFDKHDEWRSGNIKMRAQTIDFAIINYFQKLGTCYVYNPSLISHFENLGSNISPHYGTSSKKWKHSFFYNSKDSSSGRNKYNRKKSNRKKSNRKKSNRKKSNRKK